MPATTSQRRIWSLWGFALLFVLAAASVPAVLHFRPSDPKTVQENSQEEFRLCLPRDLEEASSGEGRLAQAALEECTVARHYAGRGYAVLIYRYSPEERWQVRSARPVHKER